MSIPSELAVPIGTVAAALISGGVAFLVSVFTKEARISEFRQSWIDGLRADVAELVGLVYYIATDFDQLKVEPGFDWHQYTVSIKDELLKIDQLQARIELRLNATEHAAVIKQLRNLVSGKALTCGFQQRKSDVEAFMASIQTVPKHEWKRVKAGEKTYQVTKWVSLGVVGVAVIIGIVVFAFHLYQRPPSPPTPVGTAAKNAQLHTPR